MHKTKQDWWMAEMVIDDSFAMLARVLSAIEKWEDIAWAEFEEWKKEIDQKHPHGFDHGCDPINDEGVMFVYTEDALYGSLAVSIAALVENQLPCLFCRGTMFLRDNGNSNCREARKPHFKDYMYTLEKKCDCDRRDIRHFGDHLFLRELANRFKHSGGYSTQEFLDKYGTTAGVERVDERIPYNRYCWERHIQQAKELLTDVAQRLADNGDRKNN